MSATGPAPTRQQLLALLRGFLTQILPDGVEIFVGQANRVPEATSDNFVVMTPIGLKRIATTVETWSGSSSPRPSAMSHEQSVEVKIQLDVHGAGSTDLVNLITTVFRTPYAADFFYNTGIAPLTCDDGQQIPFTSGERQFEDRWVVEATFQMSVVVGTTQQFADTLAVEIETPADALPA